MTEISDDDADKVTDAMERMDDEETPKEEAVATEPPPEKPREGPEVAPASGISQAQFVQLEALAQTVDVPPANLEKMHDLQVNVQVVLGRSKLPVQEVLKLRQGSLVELDRLAGEPVDICANGRTIARGEVVVIDETFGVKVVEIEGMRQKLAASGG
jgi:flagellar motor switch protein FliN/FliY